jgi:LacI family transcriptional regulator
MATMKDVAKKAGVGLGTVSRHINKSGYVGAETRKKIAEAIKELDFQPNVLAQSLNSGRSKFIGFLVPSIRNPFFSEVVSIIENLLWERGYKLIICNVEGNIEKEKEYVKFLKQSYAAGIIISTNYSKSDYLDKIDIPIVAFDRIINDKIPYVVSKNSEGGSLAAKTLIDRGAKKILYISGNEDIWTAQSRLKGFKKEISQYQDVSFDVIFTDNEIVIDVNVLMEKLSDKSFDGVVVWNEKIASNALMVINQLQVNVPEELQIVSFDGLFIGENTYPKLTTIKQEIQAMSEKVVELVIGLDENKNEIQIDNEFEMNIILRETTRQI